ncbi:hypothetical protein GDO78_007959 [Eleutherodactylus coqui]|uniref:Uncharacterized protein n=1 Tax=Eleutherodactylus coqui TaxID=57060 RepID=A0A8J6FIC6_ELECQ|nr:hypothetical protein GDO78_007959 [Eleutherodactylus coqui]
MSDNHPPSHAFLGCPGEYFCAVVKYKNVDFYYYAETAPAPERQSPPQVHHCPIQGSGWTPRGAWFHQDLLRTTFKWRPDL